MPNHLELPDELKHLIEKRADEDRRDRDAAAGIAPVPPVDVAAAERRQSGRRAVDGEPAERELPEAK